MQICKIQIINYKVYLLTSCNKYFIIGIYSFTEITNEI